MLTRHLSEIWIYPIKSLGGIRMRQSIVKPKGLEFDRRYMLIDEHGRFLTQREHTQMAQFHITLRYHQLEVKHWNASSVISLNLNQDRNGKTFKATIWDDTVDVIEVGEEYSNWFSEHLNIKCRLVYFPEKNNRAVDTKYAVGNDHVSLADGYPFLIIGQSSLDDLNIRLKEPVPMNRFRPNFVFTGGMANEEDGWKEFKIGANRFVGVKPCARCVLTTVDQSTSMKGTEPLATLATYRKEGNKILFGQNLLALDYDTVHEGDSISFY